MNKYGREIIHGHSTRKAGSSPTYNSWRGMIERCTNPHNSSFKNYGNRGVKVCPRWSIFSNFLADMGLRPEGQEIEREDNDGNYEPSNCRWATRAKNCRNRRSTKLREAQVDEIRGLRQSGLSLRKIASKYAVTKSAIQKALRSQI